MKTRIKNLGRGLVDRVASRLEARLTASLDPRTTPATKIGQLQLWHHYRTQIEAGRAPRLSETGFRCFSQFEEDGMILNGASPVAMEKLARRKGYRLVGANRLGFNTIYIREGLAPTLPRVSVESILSHPRNKERSVLFEPIKDWKYEQG